MFLQFLSPEQLRDPECIAVRLFRSESSHSVAIQVFFALHLVAVGGTAASSSVVVQLCPPLAQGGTAAPVMVVVVLVALVVVTAVGLQ